MEPHARLVLDFPVYGLALLPGGAVALAGGGGRMRSGVPNRVAVRGFDPSAGAFRAEDPSAVPPAAPADAPIAVAAAPASRLLHTLAGPGVKNYVYDAENRALEPESSFEHDVRVSADAEQVALAVSADGEILAIAAEAGDVRTLLLPDCAQLAHFRAHAKGVDSLDVTADGRRVASASARDRSAFLWDARSGVLLQRLSAVHAADAKTHVRAVRFSTAPDAGGALLFVAESNPRAGAWVSVFRDAGAGDGDGGGGGGGDGVHAGGGDDAPAPDFRPVASVKVTAEALTAMAVHADGRIAVASAEGHVALFRWGGGSRITKLWSTERRVSWVRPPVPPHFLPITAISFSHTGSHVLAASADFTVTSWPARRPRFRLTFRGLSWLLAALTLALALLIAEDSELHPSLVAQRARLGMEPQVRDARAVLRPIALDASAAVAARIDRGWQATEPWVRKGLVSVEPHWTKLAGFSRPHVALVGARIRELGVVGKVGVPVGSPPPRTLDPAASDEKKERDISDRVPRDHGASQSAADVGGEESVATIDPETGDNSAPRKTPDRPADEPLAVDVDLVASVAESGGKPTAIEVTPAAEGDFKGANQISNDLVNLPPVASSERSGQDRAGREIRASSPLGDNSPPIAAPSASELVHSVDMPYVEDGIFKDDVSSSTVSEQTDSEDESGTSVYRAPIDSPRGENRRISSADGDSAAGEGTLHGREVGEPLEYGLRAAISSDEMTAAAPTVFQAVTQKDESAPVLRDSAIAKASDSEASVMGNESEEKASTYLEMDGPDFSTGRTEYSQAQPVGDGEASSSGTARPLSEDATSSFPADEHVHASTAGEGSTSIESDSAGDHSLDVMDSLPVEPGAPVTAPPPPLAIHEDDGDQESEEEAASEETVLEDDATSLEDEVAAEDISSGLDREWESTEFSEVDQEKLGRGTSSDSHFQNLGKGEDMGDRDPAKDEKERSAEAVRDMASSADTKTSEVRFSRYEDDFSEVIAEAGKCVGNTGGFFHSHLGNTVLLSMKDSAPDLSKSDGNDAEVQNRDSRSRESTGMDNVHRLQNVMTPDSMEGRSIPAERASSDEHVNFEQNASTDELVDLVKGTVLSENVAGKEVVEPKEPSSLEDSSVQGIIGMDEAELSQDSANSRKSMEERDPEIGGSSETVSANNLEGLKEGYFEFDAQAGARGGEFNVEESSRQDLTDVVGVDVEDDVESDDTSVGNDSKVRSSTETALPEETGARFSSEADKLPSSEAAFEGLGAGEGDDKDGGVDEIEYSGDEIEGPAVTPDRSSPQPVSALDVTAESDDAIRYTGNVETSTSADFRADESARDEEEPFLSAVSENVESDDGGVTHVLGNDGNDGLSSELSEAHDLGSHDGVVPGSES